MKYASIFGCRSPAGAFVRNLGGSRSGSLLVDGLEWTSDSIVIAEDDPLLDAEDFFLY